MTDKDKSERVIICCEDEPVFEVLRAIKTRFFGQGIKQLLHARVACVAGRGFWFDLVKFERDPFLADEGKMSDNDSQSAVSFDFSKTGSLPVVSVVLNSAGLSRVFFGGQEQPCLTDVFVYRGSDEMGWHWGVRFHIDESVYPPFNDKAFALFPGDTVRGNIYARCTGGVRPHFCAAAPFFEDSVFCGRNHALFTLER